MLRYHSPLTLSHALDWHTLSDTEQAQLRFSLMRELCWHDWDQRPAWWWSATHRDILELKMACALVRPAQPPVATRYAPAPDVLTPLLGIAAQLCAVYAQQGEPEWLDLLVLRAREVLAQAEEQARQSQAEAAD